jgi:hypothetical protein
MLELFVVSIQRAMPFGKIQNRNQSAGKLDVILLTKKQNTMYRKNNLLKLDPETTMRSNSLFSKSQFDFSFISNSWDHIKIV